MKYRIARVEDTDEMREIHKMIFSAKWPGDDHEFWVAYDGTAVVGFASAVMLTATAVYLSRCAIVQKHIGKGLHRKLIEARVKWAMREGAFTVVTHTQNHNYPAILNLLKCGFRFVRSLRGWSQYHVMYKGALPSMDTIDQMVDK